MRILTRLLLLAATLLPGAVSAVISCSVSSPGFAAAYDPAAPGFNTTQTSFTVTCTRGSLADPASVSYGVTVDNGLYPTGANNRAAFGANRIRYDVYRDAACTSKWKGATAISGTINFSGTGTVTQNQAYWGCVNPGQGVAAGTYTDSVAMTLAYGAFTAVGAFAVSISTPATCAMTTAPGNVVFNYLAFGPAQAPTTTFGVTCTNALPYTMALDATSGTLLGLDYTLALSTASSVGIGAAQTHTITGTMAAGQSGTCAAGTCTASQARTLTITY